jgi:integrase
MSVKVRERKDKMGKSKGWYVLTDWNGQRKAKYFGKDEKQAKKFAEKLEARLKWAEQSGETIVLTQPEQVMPTVKTYLEDWLNTYAKIYCKPSTYRGYQRSVEKQLIPAFGHHPLHGLKREHVKRFVASKAEELVARAKKPNDEASGPIPERKKARWTIQGYLVPLKAAYNQAIEDGLVVMNPAARLGRLFRSTKDRRSHIQPLTREEVVTLLTEAGTRYPVLAPLLLCGVRTGLRLGELIGLQWSEVDFHGGFLEVRRAVVMGDITTPKNDKIRRVDMSPQLADMLRRLKELRQLESMAHGTAIPEWVFLSPEGLRWEERNLRRGWYRLLSHAGLRRVRFHDLRHTWVSLLIQTGAHAKYIQEQAGHSSIQVTMDTYGHLFPNENRGWVNRLDESGSKAESATQPQPHAGAAEQGSDKSLVSLVAVTRIERVTRGL